MCSEAKLEKDVTMARVDPPSNGFQKLAVREGCIGEIIILIISHHFYLICVFFLIINEN